MAKHGSGTKVYVTGHDLSSWLKSASVSVEVETHDRTTFGAAGKLYHPGLQDGTLSADGIFDAAVSPAKSVDDRMAELLGLDNTVVTVFQGGESLGARGKSMLAIDKSYSVESPVDDLVSLSFEAQSKAGIDPVICFHPQASRATTGTGTAIDNLAASTLGVIAYLHVFAVTGSVVVKVESSSDNGGSDPWAPLVTFASAAAVGAQRIALAGAVERYLRVSWTITGGPAVFSVAVGRK